MTKQQLPFVDKIGPFAEKQCRIFPFMANFAGEKYYAMKGKLILLLAIVPLLGGCLYGNIDVDDSPAADSGSGTAGVEDEGDDIENTSADRVIRVVFSDTSGASVSGDELGIISVNGNDVTAVNESGEVIRYELSGSTSDGYFKLYSETEQIVSLGGVSITNPAGAAINNQSHKRTFVVLTGSNTLKDGATISEGNYPDENGNEDMKAAFFSEGQLIFSGDGSLTVTATGKSGITSDDYLRFTDGPSLSVSSSAGHGLRAKDAIIISGGTIGVSVSGTGKKGISTDGYAYFGGGDVTVRTSGDAGTVDGELSGVAGVRADNLFTIAGGTLEIISSGKGAKGISCDGEGHFEGGSVSIVTSGANYGSSSSGGGFGWPGQDSSSSSSKSSKGIKFDGDLYFSGADVTVKCSSHEGIESKGKISITAGSVSSTAYDDAINSSSDMSISGGYVYANSTGNDGLDANGNLYISGGVVYAVGCGSPEVAVDANTEGGYSFYLSGGTLIAVGGIESGSKLSQAVLSAGSWTKSSNYALYDGDSLLFAFKTPTSGGSGIILSCPTLQSGSSYTFKSGVSISGGTSYFDAVIFDATVSGGSSTSLTASYQSGGNAGGGGGNPGGGGGRPR